MKVAFFLALAAVAFAAPAKEAPAVPKTVSAALPFAPKVYSGSNWLGGSGFVYASNAESASTAINAPITTYGAPLSAIGTPLTTYGAHLTNYWAPLTTYGAPLTTYGAPLTYTAGIHAPMVYTAGVAPKTFAQVTEDGATHITY